MTPNQPPSKPQESSPTDSLKGTQSGAAVDVAEPRAENPQPSQAEASLVIWEILGALLKEIETKKPKSRFDSIWHSPFAVGVIGVAGGLIVGVIPVFYFSRQKILEYNLSTQQQEVARQHSFSDELNKITIQKYGEVWETLDANELIIDSLLDDSTQETEALANAGAYEAGRRKLLTNEEKLREITRLIREDKVILNRNRFWIGEELYEKTRNYLDLSVSYALKKFMSVGIDLDNELHARQASKQDILKLRRTLLAMEAR